LSKKKKNKYFYGNVKANQGIPQKEEWKTKHVKITVFVLEEQSCGKRKV